MMEFTVVRARQDDRQTIANLLEKYLYEFSQYSSDFFDENGQYGYPYLYLYWAEDGRHPYLIYADGALAGFALVNHHPECELPVDHAMAEFFIAHPFRRRGGALAVMRRLTALHPGQWHIRFHPDNAASAALWRRTGAVCGHGAYRELTADASYGDGSPGHVIVLNTNGILRE